MSFPFAGTHSATEWADWYRTNTDIVEDGVQIATDPYPSYEAPRPIGDGEFDAVDVTVDGCGTAYILSTDGSVYRYDSDLERLSRLDCVWDPNDGGAPSAIAVAEDTLYVADRATGRVQALSVHLLQTRWIESGFSDPIGLTVSEGTVYILDALDEAPSSGSVDGRLQRLSPRGEVQTVVEHEYSPTDLATDDAGNVVVLGPETDTVIDLFEPATLAASGGDAVPDLRVPTDSFPVTSRGPQRPRISVEAVGVAELLVGIGSANPDETGLFRYRPDEGGFEPMPGIDGSVVELQTGNPGRDGTDPPLYLIDGEGRDVHMLAADGRMRRSTADGDYRADLVGRFDSGERGMQWHRVTLGLTRGDTRARTKTQVRLQYAATDDDWQPEGSDVAPSDPPGAIEGIGSTDSTRLQSAGFTELRDLVAVSPGRLALLLRTDSHRVSLRAAADLLHSARAALRGESVEVQADGRIEWRDIEQPNPEDALIPEAEGRYLWLKLTLVGDQGASPHVDSVRAYFPRQSYLRHLPAVYREEATSATFLERYLSIFESTFVDIEEQIASSSKYIDPGGIPTEHLQWLGEWLAVEADETWSADALQALIEAAPALYRKRGTAEGLLATIRLYLRHSDVGVIPRGPELVTDGTGASFSPQRDDERDQETESKAVYLIEHGDLSCIDCREVRRLYDRLISCSHGFLVLLHPDVTDAAAETIGRIVEAQQPAHATGRTVHLRDTTVLNGTGKEGAGTPGHHTYLGVNSRLSSREFKLGESVVGQESRLGTREPDGQLELKSRLGEDSRLS
ncbi:hypothetical protein Harman_33090 [Haloarcula mannanilytica]|uniref:Phage tail protein n=1 Tax=Haloarcula mannanilytica TaxID=2509225 RepID=A0A4C2ELE8_9EURY|nr:phage tail protein [Haloarcula mannanilytica]GCF15374.1 hypothetical protein Harman_33090 [Haloarcula mannanilytica]